MPGLLPRYENSASELVSSVAVRYVCVLDSLLRITSWLTSALCETAYQRERPHLIFAEDGVTPLALSTAAMHGPPVIPGSFAQNRTSFTLVQALNQH